MLLFLLVFRVGEFNRNINILTNEKELLQSKIETLNKRIYLAEMDKKIIQQKIESKAHISQDNNVALFTYIIETENPRLKGMSKVIAMSYEIVSQVYEQDPFLLLAIGKVESNFQPEAISYAGARGIHQMMPSTMKFISEDMELPKYNIHDILTNMTASAEFLYSLKEKYTLEEALTHYNEGGDFRTLSKRTNARLNTNGSYVNKVLYYKEKFKMMSKNFEGGET